jgi:hypothetical protein
MTDFLQDADKPSSQIPDLPVQSRASPASIVLNNKGGYLNALVS